MVRCLGGALRHLLRHVEQSEAGEAPHALDAGSLHVGAQACNHMYMCMDMDMHMHMSCTCACTCTCTCACACTCHVHVHVLEPAFMCPSHALPPYAPVSMSGP